MCWIIRRFMSNTGSDGLRPRTSWRISAMKFVSMNGTVRVLPNLDRRTCVTPAVEIEVFDEEVLVLDLLHSHPAKVQALRDHGTSSCCE